MSAALPESILFDARTVAPGMGGVGRYALNLLWALSVAEGAPPVRALVRREVLEMARRDPALDRVELIEAPGHEEHPRADWWLERRLPRLMRPGELFHGPAFLVPGGRRRLARGVAVHDRVVFTDPRVLPLPVRLWGRGGLRGACRWAERIIVPTDAIARQVGEFGLAPAEKIRVVHEAPDDTHTLWDRHALDAGGLLMGMLQETSRPLILSIGTLDPRKDPATARRAHLELLERLQLAPVPAVPGGGGSATEAGGTARAVGGAGDEPSVRAVDWIWLGGAGAIADDSPLELRRRATAAGFREIGHVPKEAVRAALRSAATYVSCSRAEGFGLPLVEAMVAGCPVVASDIPVHHEILGDAALYFPAGDAAALADILHRLLAKNTLRERLIARGLERQEAFRWQQAARQTLAVYAEAAAAHGGAE